MPLANNSFVSSCIRPGFEPFVSNQLQMLNTMNFIWAFNFDKAIDPNTKEPIPVDLWAYHKVLSIN